MVKLNVYIFMDVRVILCLSDYGFRVEVLHQSGGLLPTLNLKNRLYNIPFITSKAKSLLSERISPLHLSQK
jgi:hypothetical protein